jgi:hypothetical protein
MSDKLSHRVKIFQIPNDLLLDLVSRRHFAHHGIVQCMFPDLPNDFETLSSWADPCTRSICVAISHPSFDVIPLGIASPTVTLDQQAIHLWRNADRREKPDSNKQLLIWGVLHGDDDPNLHEGFYSDQVAPFRSVREGHPAIDAIRWAYLSAFKPEPPNRQ